MSKKSPNTDFVVFLTLFSGLLGLFRHFFDNLGQEAREHLFETFWGFRAQRASGLLYMAAPIASQVTDLDVTVLGFSGPGLPFLRQVLCGDAPRLFSIILVCI